MELEISKLIKLRDAVLGGKLLNAMDTPEGINSLVDMMADCQAESMKAAYQLGLREGLNSTREQAKQLLKV